MNLSAYLYINSKPLTNQGRYKMISQGGSFKEILTEVEKNFQDAKDNNIVDMTLYIICPEANQKIEKADKERRFLQYQKLKKEFEGE